eukprot:7571849-Pyramimonas_sp.AAC.1
MAHPGRAGPAASPRPRVRCGGRSAFAPPARGPLSRVPRRAPPLRLRRGPGARPSALAREAIGCDL